MAKLSNASIVIRPGFGRGTLMKHLEDIVITIVFIGVVAGLSTCEPNKKSCDVIHEAAKPAHRCENFE